MIYELIGRMVVQALKLRYGREIRIAAGAGLVLTVLGVGAYLASRGGEEGRRGLEAGEAFGGSSWVCSEPGIEWQGTVRRGRVGARQRRSPSPRPAVLAEEMEPAPASPRRRSRRNPDCSRMRLHLSSSRRGFVTGTRPMLLLVSYQRNMDCFIR